MPFPQFAQTLTVKSIANNTFCTRSNWKCGGIWSSNVWKTSESSSTFSTKFEMSAESRRCAHSKLSSVYVFTEEGLFYIYILQFVHLFGQGNSSLAYALPLTSLACPFDLSCSVSCVVHFHTQTFPCGRMCRWGWGEIFGSDERRTTEVKRPRGPSPRNVRSIDCHDARLVQGIAPNVQWTHRARKTSTSIYLTNQLRFCAVCFRFKFDYFFKIKTYRTVIPVPIVQSILIFLKRNRPSYFKADWRAIIAICLAWQIYSLSFSVFCR